MIWNKRLEHTTKIYDLQNNTMYEDNEIEYGITDESCDIEAFLQEARKQVSKYSVEKGKVFKSGYQSTGVKNLYNRKSTTNKDMEYVGCFYENDDF